MVLSGNNTYTGGTDIEGGTLQLGDGTTDGSLVGDITDNSALVFDDESALTYTGLISGGGSVAQIGGGTLTLTGQNTYTGGTTISGGTLQLGDGTTDGSLVGDITDNAALVFDNQAALTYTGVISGGGSLTKTGGDTLTLTGQNTYTGGTAISAGTLQLGDGTTDGSLVGDITDSVALVFDDQAALTYAGVISGGGSVAQIGGGTLILTGQNNYTGGTDIEGGTLQLGDGAADGSLVGDITDNATLVFNDQSALTYASVISGSGSLTKTGSGTLILTGVNTYSGSTNVNGGTLELAGPVNVSALSAGATVNINDGGTLLADTNNCFGAGSSQPPIVINSGGCMTTADGVVVTVNSLTLAGGTLSSSQIPCPGWGSWYMIGPVHATADSTIDAVQMYLAGATFTVDSGVTLDVPGSFTHGSDGLIKSGAGTLKLDGCNTFSGTTTIDAGSLTLDNASALADSTLDISSAAQ